MNFLTGNTFSHLSKDLTGFHTWSGSKIPIPFFFILFLSFLKKKRRMGRKERKLMFITCLQDLGCSKSPSWLAFACSLRRWGAWSVYRMPPVYARSRREIADRGVLGCPGSTRCSELTVIHRSAARPQPGDCGDPGPGRGLHPNHVPASV